MEGQRACRDKNYVLYGHHARSASNSSLTTGKNIFSISCILSAQVTFYADSSAALAKQGKVLAVNVTEECLKKRASCKKQCPQSSFNKFQCSLDRLVLTSFVEPIPASNPITYKCECGPDDSELYGYEGFQAQVTVTNCPDHGPWLIGGGVGAGLLLLVLTIVSCYYW